MFYTAVNVSVSIRDGEQTANTTSVIMFISFLTFIKTINENRKINTDMSPCMLYLEVRLHSAQL